MLSINHYSQAEPPIQTVSEELLHVNAIHLLGCDQELPALL